MGIFILDFVFTFLHRILINYQYYTIILGNLQNSEQVKKLCLN